MTLFASSVIGAIFSLNVRDLLKIGVILLCSRLHYPVREKYTKKQFSCYLLILLLKYEITEP